MIRRSEYALWSPPISIDFMARDWDGNLLLDRPGTVKDLERWGIELADGMKLVLFDTDGSERQIPDDLVGIGVAMFDPEEGRWVATDWTWPVHYSALDDDSQALYRIYRPQMKEFVVPASMLRRNDSELWSPPVWVNFKKGTHGRWRLDNPRTKRDLDRWGITLEQGRKLVVFGPLYGEERISLGTAMFDLDAACWTADPAVLLEFDDFDRTTQQLLRRYRPELGRSSD